MNEKELSNLRNAIKLIKAAKNYLAVNNLMGGYSYGHLNEAEKDLQARYDIITNDSTIIEFCGESCSWCKNRGKNCVYNMKTMEETRNKVKSILHGSEAYCHGMVTCDHYIKDEKEYYTIYPNEWSNICQNE